MVYRFIRGNGGILDTFKQAKKYGMDIVTYWNTYDFPSCDKADTVEELLPELFDEDGNLKPQTASTTNEKTKFDILLEEHINTVVQAKELSDKFADDDRVSIEAWEIALDSFVSAANAYLKFKEWLEVSTL